MKRVNLVLDKVINYLKQQAVCLNSYVVRKSGVKLHVFVWFK